MSNNGAVSKSLNCGESYTIPAGYHNGSGKVTSNNLASQTSGSNIDASFIPYNYTVYTNGNRLIGTLKGVKLKLWHVYLYLNNSGSGGYRFNSNADGSPIYSGQSSYSYGSSYTIYYNNNGNDTGKMVFNLIGNFKLTYNYDYSSNYIQEEPSKYLIIQCAGNNGAVVYNTYICSFNETINVFYENGKTNRPLSIRVYKGSTGYMCMDLEFNTWNWPQGQQWIWGAYELRAL